MTTQAELAKGAAPANLGQNQPSIVEGLPLELGDRILDVLPKLTAQREALPDPEMEGRPKVRKSIEERGRLLDRVKNAIVNKTGVVAKKLREYQDANTEVEKIEAIVKELKRRLADAEDQLATLPPGDESAKAGREAGHLREGISDTEDGFRWQLGAGAVTSTTVAEVYTMFGRVPGQGRTLNRAREWRDICKREHRRFESELVSEIETAERLVESPLEIPAAAI